MESGLQKAETNAHEAKLFKVAGGMRPVMTEDHMGEEIVHVDDGDEEAECDEEWTEHLPLDGRGQILDKDAAADKAVTTEVAKSIDLFKVSDVSGQMKTEQVKEGNLSKDDLDPN